MLAGKRAARVGDQVLKEIAAIGREGKWVGGRLRIPHIYCASLAVSTKG